MINLKSVFLFIAISISTNGLSQENVYNLSKFKLPDLERHVLETNFRFWGYNQFEKSHHEVFGQEENGVNQYNGNLFINYDHYLNNSKHQRQTNFKLDFSSDISSRNQMSDNINYYSNAKSISPLLHLQRDNRSYFSDRIFYEADVIIDYQYGYDNRLSSVDGSESNDNTQTHAAYLSFPLKFGTGRIEQIQDARHAIYIFDALAKIDSVTSFKSDDQITEFGKLISKLKNKRFFDSRFRRIAELETVDSFLIANNYISEQDAEYFTTIGDIWAYGNRPFRNSGKRLSVALLPGFYYYDFNRTMDQQTYNYSADYTLSAFLIDGGIEYKHEQPINLYWQNSFDFRCYAGIIEGRLNNRAISSKNNIRIPNIQLGFNQTIGYYPNTRTDMSLGYSIQYVQLFDETDLQAEILGVEGKGVKATATLSINYYISPKFRFYAAYRFNYIWQDSKDEVLINFDNIAGSYYLLNNFTPYENSTFYRDKNIFQYFDITLAYSIF